MKALELIKKSKAVTNENPHCGYFSDIFSSGVWTAECMVADFILASRLTVSPLVPEHGLSIPCPSPTQPQESLCVVFRTPAGAGPNWEFLVSTDIQILSFEGLECIYAWPNMPFLALTPWQRYAHHGLYQSLENSCLGHLEDRDGTQARRDPADDWEGLLRAHRDHFMFNSISISVSIIQSCATTFRSRL